MYSESSSYPLICEKVLTLDYQNIHNTSTFLFLMWLFWILILVAHVCVKIIKTLVLNFNCHMVEDKLLSNMRYSYFHRFSCLRVMIQVSKYWKGKNIDLSLNRFKIVPRLIPICKFLLHFYAKGAVFNMLMPIKSSLYQQCWGL